MEDVLIVAIAVGLPVMIPIIAIYSKHRQKMASMHATDDQTRAEISRLSAEHQEFVLGVDARIHRLEERIRSLEARLRQSGDSGDVQNIRRG